MTANKSSAPGPGRPTTRRSTSTPKPPDCGYVYKRSSAGYPNDAVTVTATLYYHATWSAAGAPGGGDLGLISATSAPVSVRVNEIHVVIIPWRPPVTATRSTPAIATVPISTNGQGPAPGRNVNIGRMALGVFLVLGLSVWFAYLYSQAGQRHSVLAVARAVPVGQALVAADLKEVLVSADPG